VLYTSSLAQTEKIPTKMKQYFIISSHGNDEVVPDKRDTELYNMGKITAKGFALNYDVKLRSKAAQEWMERVSTEASHEDIILVGEEDQVETSPRKMLAEMMYSMFGGRNNFRYAGEL
jgi:Domain of unknown function DUF488